MKPKVYFLHNVLKDYRIPWFNEMDKEIDLTLIFFRDSKDKINNMNIKYLKCEALPHFKLFSKYGLSISLIPRLLFGKYDVVISDDLYFFETYFAFFISKLRRKKHIVWVETFEWPRAPRSKIIQPFVKLVARHSNAVIAVGKKSKEYLLKLGAQEKNIFISPDTSICEVYDLEKYKKEFYKKYPKIKNKQIVLYLSRIVRYKGLDILIKSFLKLEEEIENIVLVIATSNLEMNNFTKDILEFITKSKNIYLITDVNPQNKGFYYSIADIFVLPSTFRDYDADCWGVVLNEAMSLGKPVISTDATGGAHDLIIQGKNGYMIKQKDIDELSSALKKILSNKRFKESMGKESKEIIEKNFTYEKMAQGCVDAIIYSLYHKNLKGFKS